MRCSIGYRIRGTAGCLALKADAVRPGATVLVQKHVRLGGHPSENWSDQDLKGVGAAHSARFAPGMRSARPCSPYPDPYRAMEVGSLVNNVRHNGPEVVAPARDAP